MIQILMPLAGGAKPFNEKGETFPKALIEVLSYPLVEYAIKSCHPKEKHLFIFVVDDESATQYHLDHTLKVLAPDSKLVIASGRTGGALCTCLLAVDHINPDLPLLICNGDQFLEEGVDDALASFRERELDVGIITFKSAHPRWSFVRRGSDDLVHETAEKDPISNEATVGVYYFRSASSFVDAATKSLLKHVTYKDQFFVVPSINQVILNGGRVGAYLIKNQTFHPLGIPEDVEQFSRHYRHSPLS